MDRRAWLAGQRARIEEHYDRQSSSYDDDDVPITPVHRRFIEAVIDSCPLGGTILDAPCGTGRCFELVLGAGRNVVGIDQSTGMLAQARDKYPKVVLRRLRLEELDFDHEFHAAMCVDAMEYVPPEAWPVVLGNLHRAIRPGGLVYLTVEQIDQEEVADVFAEARAAGAPVEYGENLRRGGGYHFYPAPERVLGWIETEGLEVVRRDVASRPQLRLPPPSAAGADVTG